MRFRSISEIKKKNKFEQKLNIQRILDEKKLKLKNNNNEVQHINIKMIKIIVK